MPTTCAAASAGCGALDDGCGGHLPCGACEGDRVCSTGHACVAPRQRLPYDVGLSFHATGPDFGTDAFLKRYDEPGVRDEVRRQLSELAQAGATTLFTRVWFVTAPGVDDARSWTHHFPLSARELANLRRFAGDVAAVTAGDGRPFNLYLGLAWLWCAEYTQGERGAADWGPARCGHTPDSFLATAKTAVGDIVTAVEGISSADGQPTVSRLYLDLEVLTAIDDTDPATQFEKKNQRWFLAQLYPWFMERVRAAGIIPTLYFLADLREQPAHGHDYRDAYASALDGHLYAYWVYRSLAAMKALQLPLPERVDLSVYPLPGRSNHATIAEAFLDDLDQLLPALLGRSTVPLAVSETSYFPEPSLRYLVNKAWAATMATRSSLKELCFWTTPDGGGPGVHLGPPFDFASYSAVDLVRPTLANPGFEAPATGSAAPASWTLEWVNGPVQAASVERASPGRTGSSELRLTAGNCPTCTGASDGVFVLSDVATAPASAWAVVKAWTRTDAPQAGDGGAADPRTGAVLTLLSGARSLDTWVSPSSSWVKQVLVLPTTDAGVQLRPGIVHAWGTALEVDDVE